MSASPVTVEVLCGTAAEAARIGATAVRQRLAASAHHFPVGSTYRWQGTVHHSREYLLRVTSTREALDRLLALIAAEHEYDLPHVTIHDAPTASKPVAEWIVESVPPAG